MQKTEKKKNHSLPDEQTRSHGLLNRGAGCGSQERGLLAEILATQIVDKNRDMESRIEAATPAYRGDSVRLGEKRNQCWNERSHLDSIAARFCSI
jgi:hypothetical protein